MGNKSPEKPKPEPVDPNWELRMASRKLER